MSGFKRRSQAVQPGHSASRAGFELFWRGLLRDWRQVILPDSGISVGITNLQVPDNKSYGGEGGIRTPGTLSGTVVFKTTRFNRSRTSPRLVWTPV